MNNFITTIEARMSSTRLPGKIILPIGKKTAIELLIERIKKSKYTKKIIVATTKNKNDDLLIKILKKNKIKYYRGDEKNVLKRLYLATKKHPENLVIQLTADNPLIDYKIIDYIAEFFIKNYPKYDFVTNNNLFDKTKFSFPLGMNVSIFKKKHLSKICKIAKKKDLQEHPTLYFYREGIRKFRSHNIPAPSKWRNTLSARFTLDTVEDYKFLKNLFSKLNYKTLVTLEEILIFLKKNIKFIKINKNIKQKTPKGIFY
jgi:spore coat polysaccharide biosynthesis protein SpsF